MITSRHAQRVGTFISPVDVKTGRRNTPMLLLPDIVIYRLCSQKPSSSPTRMIMILPAGLQLRVISI